MSTRASADPGTDCDLDIRGRNSVRDCARGAAVSDTPITDAAEWCPGCVGVDDPHRAVVDADIARQLERKISEHKRNHSACEFSGAAIKQQSVRIDELELDLARMTKVAHELAECVDVYHKLAGGQTTKAKLAIEELKTITGRKP